MKFIQADTMGSLKESHTIYELIKKTKQNLKNTSRDDKQNLFLFARKEPNVLRYANEPNLATVVETDSPSRRR